MAMRMSGLMSGMDTESIVQELVAVKQTQVDNLKKEQTKLEWKQEAWKDLNAKIKKLYSGTLDNLRFQSAYAKKTTKISDSSVAEIITADSAMNSVQKLKVTALAQTGYLTGAEITKTDGSKCTTATKLSDIGVTSGRITVTTAGKTTEIEIKESMTLADLTTALTDAGVNANFDSKTGRMFIGAKESGVKHDFAITASNAAGTDALSKLGILVYDETTNKQYDEYAALNDTGNEDKYQAAIDAEVARRLANYIKQQENLTKNITSYEETLTKYREKFVEEFPDDDLDAYVNNTDGALDTFKADIDTLKAEIEALKENEEDNKAAIEEKQKELDKMNSKLAQIENYQAVNKNLEAANTKLAETESYINMDDKTASDKLKTEVGTWLDERITHAESIQSGSNTGSVGATKTIGQDAEIYLNGARFEASSNTFEINGLTITCNAETGDKEVTLTTQDDTSGVYDMIKKFITEYSTLMNEMDKLYNADSAKGYEPLTEDEKYEMSEKQIEKWEDKIKASLLRRDATLSTVSSAFKSIMSSGFMVDGKMMYLSDFGVETLGYFEAEENEKNMYHILGDEDDSAVSSKTNQLKAMITTDPDKVMDFFSQLTKSLYEKTSELMASVKDYSSAYTVYEDKKMKSDYDDYTKEIKELEKKLSAYEDKWYAKFSAMETAMAKMQSNANAITGLLGG